MNYGSEEERGKAFPIHVEMGDDGPVLDLGDRADLVNLPNKGCVLVDYERNEDGSLQVKTVCLPGASKAQKDDPMDLEEALGNNVPDEYEQGDDEDDDDEE